MNIISRSKPLLGTFVEVSITAPISDDELLEASSIAFNEIARIHNLMSFHDETSELSSINTQAFKSPFTVTTSLKHVIEHALDLSQLTDGLYDITIAHDLMTLGGLPRCYTNSVTGSWRDIELIDHSIHFTQNIKLDLGGIAKGYAVDCAVNALKALNIEYEQFCINAGGDLYTFNWENQFIDIRHPSPRKRGHFIQVAMKAPALATSAPYYTDKNSMIIRPKSGKPVSSKESISVFAPTCMIADSLTKVMFLDPENTALLKHFGAETIRINSNGEKLPIGVQL